MLLKEAALHSCAYEKMLRITGEHLCQSIILIKLQSNFIIEITLQHGCSPVNLLHIFRTPFPKGLVTHSDILKIYRIIQYSKNIFKCNMVKNIFKIYKNIKFLLKKIISF